jgi:hypothetical protein
MKQAHCAVAIAAVVAGCAAAPTEPVAPNAAQPASTKNVDTRTAGATEVNVEDINRIRCDPVTRPGTRIVIGEECYPVGRPNVDEEALSEQLEQVRRDQEELDRRRREAEARKGPGL